MADRGDVPLVATPATEEEQLPEEKATIESSEIAQKTETKDATDADKCTWSDCCRWCCKLFVVVLCLPFLLIISLLGLILTIIIFPCKCCSPCCAPCCQGLIDGVTYILKAPFKLVLWATERITDDDEEKESLIKKDEKAEDVEQG